MARSLLFNLGTMGVIASSWKSLDSSVRARVLVPCAVLFAVTLATMVLAAVEMLGSDLEKNVQRRAEMFVHLAADGLTAAMVHAGPTALPDILSAVNQHRDDIDSVSLLRSDGAVVSSSDAALVGKTLPHEGGMPEDRTVIRSVNSEQYMVLRPIENEAKCVRCHGQVSQINGWLEARFSRKPITAAKFTLLRKLAVAAVPSFLALLAIAWWLLGREVVSPLQRLVGAMRRAEAGQIAVGADDGRPDELGIASRGFDATLAALRRSRQELEMVYAERMVRADRFAAVGEMATGLAHEIKNPLAGLTGALELLAEDLAGAPQAEMVSEMRHAVARLTQTMDSLLRFARPPRPLMRSMDQNAALENVLFLVRQLHSRALVTVVRSGDATLPPVHGDPAQIEQVFLNVCLNAHQAMSAAGGTLTVSSFARAEQVIVQVADTGPGIPAEVRPHVFTPFFTTRHDGNGLGLAISARIVVEHGGHIEFSCPDGGGTVFSVSLPVASAKEQAA